MKRKSVMVVLGILAILSVTACGEKNQNTPVVNQADTAKQTQAAEPTETVKPQASAETKAASATDQSVQEEKEASDDSTASSDNSVGNASSETELPEQGWSPVLLYDENMAPDGQDTSADVNDPYDLYSWDEGTNSYIPYQAADSSGTAIGRGNGWYYYDSQAEEYLPW